MSDTWHEPSGWSGWSDPSSTALFRCSFKYDGYWTHVLAALSDEPNPRENHIHYKYKENAETYEQHSFVLCAITVDGMRDFSRRILIDRINAITGLDLEYK